MPVLTLTVGPPGCGKTTWANDFIKKSKSKTVILNQDDIRATMAGGHWNYKFNKANEKYVQTVQCSSADVAVANKWNIVVANTNLNPSVRTEWEEYAKANGYTFKIHDFFKEFKKDKDFVHDYFAMEAFMKQCKSRNIQRSTAVPEEVIDRMFEDYYYSTIKFPVLEHNDGIRYIIVDIDGTIAHMGNKRSPYDESKVYLDDPDWEVMNTIQSEFEMDTKNTRIIVMSGRHETCRAMTEEWLQKHAFTYHYLFMRAEGDDRGDDIVKYELYMKHIFSTGKRVVKVFDDRDRVVKMWRRLLGLKVYQVAFGNF